MGGRRGGPIVNIFNAHEVSLGVSTCVTRRRQKNHTEDKLDRGQGDEKSGDLAVFPRQRVDTFENPFSQDQPFELNDRGLPNNQEYLRGEGRPNEEDESDYRCVLASGELSVF